MDIRKYAFIALGIFLLIVFLAVGVSAEFKFDTITTSPFQFIRDFFYQWSPALAAAATIAVAILALLAIYDNRRSQRLALYNQYFSQVEEWAQATRLVLVSIKSALETKPSLMSPDESIKAIASLTHNMSLAQLAIRAIGDSSLVEMFDYHLKLIELLSQAAKQADNKNIGKLADDIWKLLDKILVRANHLRSKMIK